jgi:DNA-binding phage protein
MDLEQATRKHIGKALRQRLEVSNTPIRQYARKTGIRTATVHRIITGDENYNIDTLLFILHNIGLTVQVVPLDIRKRPAPATTPMTAHSAE